MLYTASSGNGIVYLDLGQDEYHCRYSGEFIGNYYTLSASSRCSHDVFPLRESSWTAAPPLSGRPGPGDAVRFLSALIETAIVFRGASVRRLLRHVAARHLPIADPQTAAKIAAIYQFFLKTMPFKSECLFKSFLLMNFLRRYGVTAEWVFGVHLFPFRAHCWIAIGRCLLNERPHRIKDYRTILTFHEANQWQTI